MRRYGALPEIHRERPTAPAIGAASAARDRARDQRAPDSPAQSLLFLQSAAGNSAVASGIRDLRGGDVLPLALQREPKRGKADPPWIKDARSTLGKLFPKDKLVSKVVIKDYASLNKRLKGIDYAAWTNSANEIYLRDPSGLADPADPATKNLPAMFINAVLHHEAVHVRQFARDGGPPTTWQQMLEYEKEAYATDVSWLGTPEAATLIPDKGVLAQFRDQATKHLAEVTDLLSGTAKLKGRDREKALHAAMIAKTLIPASSTIDPRDLYKQPK